MSKLIKGVSYRRFFQNLIHPAFIVLFDNEAKDFSIREYKVNNIISEFFPKGKLSSNKVTNLRSVLSRIFPDNESIVDEYIIAAEFIMKHKELRTDDLDYDFPDLNHVTVVEKNDKLAIQSKKLDGIKSVLSNSENGGSFHDVFSILHDVDSDGSFDGFQAVFPIVNKRRQEFAKFKRQALISAIARVMTRNMSHNIGSHVLSRMVDPSSIKQDKIVSDNKLYYQSIFESERGGYKKSMFSKLGDVIGEKKYYEFLLANFFSYLKSRQDFLADVVSGVPQIQTTKLFVNDVMNGIDQNRLLLNRISGLEQFEFGFNFEGGLIEIKKENDGSISYPKDVKIAVSNDIMGQHAFYIILENIVRNTAKHGAKKADGEPHNLTISISESISDSSLYQLTVYDDVELEGECILQLPRNEAVSEYLHQHKNELRHYDNENVSFTPIKKEDVGYYIKSFSLTEKVEYLGSKSIKEIDGEISWFDYYRIDKIDQLVISQNILINKPVLNQESFDLRLHALGLIEMETCAAYLRRIPIEKIEAEEFRLKFSRNEIESFIKDLDETKNLPRLLRAVRPDFPSSKQKKKCLGYRFYLPKPKELLILDFEGLISDYISDSGKLKTLESEGILLLNASKSNIASEESKWIYESDKVYPQEKMLVVGKFSEQLDTHLPKRYISDEEFIAHYSKFKNTEVDNSNELIIDLLLNDTDSLKIEVLRSVVSEKFDEKGIFPLNFIYNDFINFNENHLPYPISLSRHGENYIGNSERDYIEIHASRHDPIAKIIDKDEDLTYSEELTKLKFVDAASTNILILDERIQEGCKNNYFLEGNKTLPSLKYREIWNEINVVIPDKSINLSSNILQDDLIDECRKLIKREFGVQSKRKCKYLDYIVIHLGILDRYLAKLKLDKEDNNKRNELLESLIKGIDLPYKPHFVISSGRAPTDLPDGTSYISYSTLSQYLIEDRFKYKLVEVLNSSRRKYEKRDNILHQ